MTKYVFPSDTSSATYGVATRDFIAIMAMQGLCSNPDSTPMSHKAIAKLAYSLADAMIKESEE